MKQATSLAKGLRVHVCKGDPEVSLTIPEGILKALAQRSIETGHSIEAEIIVRLAHSLIERNDCLRLKQITKHIKGDK